MDHHSPGSKESLEVGAVRMERNVLLDPIESMGLLYIYLPGDSKSIKFLGVFGVDCCFSKSDAFLIKTPQTAKTARFDFWVLLESMASI